MGLLVLLLVLLVILISPSSIVRSWICSVYIGSRPCILLSLANYRCHHSLSEVMWLRNLIRQHLLTVLSSINHLLIVLNLIWVITGSGATSRLCSLKMLTVIIIALSTLNWYCFLTSCTLTRYKLLWLLLLHLIFLVLLECLSRVAIATCSGFGNLTLKKTVIHHFQIGIRSILCCLWMDKLLRLACTF